MQVALYTNANANKYEFSYIAWNTCRQEDQTDESIPKSYNSSIDGGERGSILSLAESCFVDKHPSHSMLGILDETSCMDSSCGVFSR